MSACSSNRYRGASSAQALLQSSAHVTLREMHSTLPPHTRQEVRFHTLTSLQARGFLVDHHNPDSHRPKHSITEIEGSRNKKLRLFFYRALPCKSHVLQEQRPTPSEAGACPANGHNDVHRAGRTNGPHYWTRGSCSIDGKACSQARWHIVLRSHRLGSEIESCVA